MSMFHYTWDPISRVRLPVASGDAVARMGRALGQPNRWSMTALDNFDTATNFDYTLFDGTASGTWTTTGNKITSPSGQTGNCVALMRSVNLDDGKVQVIYENPDSTGTKWCGLTLRAKTSKDMLCILLFDGNPGQAAIWKLSSGAFTAVGTSAFLTTADVALTTGSPISLEAEVIGETIKVYVNGKLVIMSTHTDISNYSYGQCGLIAHRDKQFTFSNFSIRRKQFDFIGPSISKVVCVGSSITYGLGTKNHDPSTAWPAGLKARLIQEYCTGTVDVVNAGVSGEQTGHFLTRFQSLLTTHKPDLIVIEASVNDTKKTMLLTFDQTISNIRRMIKLAKQVNCIPVLTTATPIDPSVSLTDWDASNIQRLHQINVRVRQLAGQEGVRVIDNFNAFSNDFTLLNDKIHPNTNGAKVMTDTAFNTIIGNA